MEEEAISKEMSCKTFQKNTRRSTHHIHVENYRKTVENKKGCVQNTNCICNQHMRNVFEPGKPNNTDKRKCYETKDN
jgi:hypothetical protein